MLQLPPLNALKYFEVAARTGSYVTAAAELNVSPAAISQQVRNLESFLKRKLFTRLNNRIVLTDAGQAIHAGISPALEDIAALTQRVLAGSSRAKLVVSVIPSLAECWFMPALADFAQAGALRIDLRVENDPVDFAGGEIDLRIGYASAQYPGLASVPLFRDEVLPLCAQELAAGERVVCGRSRSVAETKPFCRRATMDSIQRLIRRDLDRLKSLSAIS